MREISREEKEQYEKGIRLAISVVSSIDPDILYKGGETVPHPNCHEVLDQNISPDEASNFFINLCKEMLSPQLKAEEIIRGKENNALYEGIRVSIETLNSLTFRASWGPKATPNFAARYTKETICNILSHNIPKEVNS